LHRMDNYVKACELSDVPLGSMHAVNLGDKKLMIVNVDGELYATDRVCTHETADLSTGFLLGSAVTCPLHLSRFDVITGEVQNPPAIVPLKTYRLKVEGTSVYVQV
jgi:3-phenylpropionate/trans-cinnamate dioxygenase ferredoxin component